MRQQQVMDARWATKWLTQFGYDSFEQFQDVSGLPVTGEACSATTELMGRPRCGVKDYATAADCRWQGKTHLLYYHGRGFNLFKRSEGNKKGRLSSENMLKSGFDVWAGVSQFTFARTPDPHQADIWIGGGRGRPHDFDGPGNTLAWAYMPCGQFDFLETRFDVDEQWTHNAGMASKQIYAPSVWLHELGHCLGLDHSRNAADLMAPYYNPNILLPQAGDVQRIQTLYV